MNIHHYNPFAFDGRGIAVVLDPGHRAQSVRLGDRGFERHGNLDKGREVWVSYGRPGAYGQLSIDGQGYAVPASRDIVYGSSIRPIQAAQAPQGPSEARMSVNSTASRAPDRNPLLPAASAAAPLLTEGGREKVAGWLDKGFSSLRSIGQRFSPSSGGGAIGAINAAAPWAIGGLTALSLGDMLLNRESGLQKWRRLAGEGYAAGQAGAERPTSLLNAFDVQSAPQLAYDAGKAGNPLAFDGGVNALEAQRRQQAEAKKRIVEQGFDEKTIRATHSGPYTRKQKAAQKILKPHTNSQVNLSNRSVLTDADRGGK